MVCGAELARRFAVALGRLPHLVLVPLDATLARQVVEVAADHTLRGSDAVYTAVALCFGSMLVTLDREQRGRGVELIPVCWPDEAFARLDPGP